MAAQQTNVYACQHRVIRASVVWPSVARRRGLLALGARGRARKSTAHGQHFGLEKRSTGRLFLIPPKAQHGTPTNSRWRSRRHEVLCTFVSTIFQKSQLDTSIDHHAQGNKKEERKGGRLQSMSYTFATRRHSAHACPLESQAQARQGQEGRRQCYRHLVQGSLCV